MTGRTIGIAFSATILTAVFGLAATAPANAESVMKVCGEQWTAAKAAGATKGETWKDFLAQCRAQQKGAATTPAATPAATTTAAAGGVKTAKECDAEYTANKAAIRASGQNKRDFVAACREGNEKVPSAAAAPAAAPAPAPAAAPAAAASGVKTAKECDAEYAADKAAIRASGQTKRDFVAACREGTEKTPAAAAPAAAPAPAPATAAEPAPAPAASRPKTTAMPSGAGQFASDAQAKARCPSDTVVWVNTKSDIYHFAGTRRYGHTKQGAYMCEADAKAAGARAAEKEKHP